MSQTISVASQSTAGPPPGSIAAAWSYRKFRILFIGTAMSSVGTWMQNFALPAYLDARTGSATLVGLLIFVQMGPLLVLSIPAGILADRFNRTQLVIAMQSTMMAMSVVLAVLISRQAPLWTIFAAQFVIGVANTVNAPAFAASTPMLVSREDLPGAVSLNSAMINGTRIAGPAIAAGLAAAGMSVAQLFEVNAATYLFLIVPLFFIKLPQPSGTPPEQGWRKLLSGINIARKRRVVGYSLATMFLFSLICLNYIGLFPSVARLNLGLDPVGGMYKLLYIVWGVGAFVGALAVGTFFAGVDKRVLIRRGLVAFGGFLMAFALSRSVWFALPISAGLGFFYFLTATALASVFQQNLSNDERGSTMPLWFMAFGGTISIGVLLAGPMMDLVGPRWVLGVGATVAVILAYKFDLTRLHKSDFLPVSDGGEEYVAASVGRQI